jgi:hypothetical protein
MTKTLHRGERHHNFKQIITYPTIHNWLVNEFGKATICESEFCSGKSKTYDWALIKGKEYERNRDSFHQLCRSCHVLYDMTSERRAKMKASAMKRGRFQGRFL